MEELGILDAELFQLIEEENWPLLAQKKEFWPDAELSAPICLDIITDLPKKSRILFFRALPSEVQVELVAHLDREAADRLLVQMTDAEAREILEELSPDDRVYLLQELPGQLTQRLMTLLPLAEQREARTLLGYPEESVGRLMTSEYVKIKAHWTVERALEHIRKYGQELESVNMVYVSELGGRLTDALALDQLVLARPESLVEDLMDGHFISLRAHDDREEAVRLMQRYGRTALPVVDGAGYLMGIVTFDDVMDVAEEEITEDFQKASAVTPLKMSYWEAGPMTLIRSRVGWLAILIFVNLISSSVIALYQDVLSGNLILAYFIPMLIATAGNTGSQSSSMMIRGLSTGEIGLDQWFRVFLKELLVGLVIGLIMGVLGFGLGFYRGGATMGLVVFATLVSLLVLANLIGILLPFLLIRFKQDPAIASGPLITSLADAVGLLIYFNWAVVILPKI